MSRFQNAAPDLMALSRELERMGGGSAATIPGGFFVRCRAAEHGPSIISLQSDSVLLSNPQNPDQRGNKTFSCNASFSASLSQLQVSEGIASSIATQLLKGFNCLLISIGETGSGKSHTLFGNSSEGSGSKGEGVAHCLIDSLLQPGASSAGLSIDISVCEIGADSCMDLFGNESLQVPLFSSALSISVSSPQESRLLIRQALQKSRNACVNPSGQLLELAPNRSHLCVRIRVKNLGRMSQVWIVDTVGSRPLAGARNSVRHFTSSPDVDREQRVLSQQLFGLNKLLSEMCSVAHGARTLESARSSNLSFLVSNLISDNHSLMCLGTVHSDASHHLDSYNTLRISSAARSIVVPCKHVKTPDDLHSIPAAQYLLHASSSKSLEAHKSSSRSPHPLPSVKSAISRAAATPSSHGSHANAFGLSTSPTHVIELGSRPQDAHFRAASEADAFEISEDGSSMVLSPLSGDAEIDFDSRVPQQKLSATKPVLSRFDSPVVPISSGRLQQLHAQPDALDDGESDDSEDNHSDGGVFFASKIINEQVECGSVQVGGWSTFLEENMSSSAASEADNGSVSDACGDFGHDSSSLKVAFHDTLAKVSPSPSKTDAAFVPADSRSTDISPAVQQSLVSSGLQSSSERFSQQQPLVRASTSRQSFPPSLPASSAISLIPVTASSPVSESFESHDASREAAQVRQVCFSSHIRLFYPLITSCRRLQFHRPFHSPYRRLYLPDFSTRIHMQRQHRCLPLCPRSSSCEITTRYWRCSDPASIRYHSFISLCGSHRAPVTCLLLNFFPKVVDLQERLRLCELELSETQMKLELDTEGSRKEVLELRSKLRLAEKDSTASELFDRYEIEIAALSASLSRSEDELVSLKCVTSESAGSADSALTMMRRTVRQQQRDMERLRRENEDMKKHQRAAMSSKKLMDDMSKKISQLNKIIVQKEEVVASKSQQLLEYEDLIRLQHKELQHTKSSEMELVSRCAALSENVSELQRQVAELSSSRRSARNIPALAPSSPSIAGMLRNSAADMCNKLERDCGASNPRCHTWIIKLREIIEVGFVLLIFVICINIHFATNSLTCDLRNTKGIEL
jgi:hypothetical protein